MLFIHRQNDHVNLLGSQSHAAGEIPRLILSSRAQKLSHAFQSDAIELIDKFKGALSIKKTRFSESIGRLRKCEGKPTPIKRVITDLYIETANRTEYHFEMKTAKPNSGQCETFNEKAMKIHLLRRDSGRTVFTFFAFSYNPYGQLRGDYKHPYPHSYCDFEQSILVGKEFWDIIGGENTYEEVLEIYKQVGKEKGPEIIEKLVYKK
jgi:hypothetical protein